MRNSKINLQRKFLLSLWIRNSADEKFLSLTSISATNLRSSSVGVLESCPWGHVMSNFFLIKWYFPTSCISLPFSWMLQQIHARLCIQVDFVIYVSLNIIPSLKSFEYHLMKSFSLLFPHYFMLRVIRCNHEAIKFEPLWSYS